MTLSRTLKIIIIIVVNISLDQISKFYVRANVGYQTSRDIIGENFILTNVENSGAFLGMGSDMSPTMKVIFLWILPILVLGYVVYYIFSNKALDHMSLLAFCCIIGGGIANVYDRIKYGSVTDFLHIDLGGGIRTGIFNVADMSVTFGMIMLLIASFVYRKKEVKD